MKSANYLGVLIAIGAMAIMAGSRLRAADMPQTNPNVLWVIVHGKCVPTQAAEGFAGPCQFVDLDAHYAVLKDLHGNTRFLLLPTYPISGIESPALLQPGAPNYWQAAWTARKFVEEKAGRAIPRDQLGLAVNSAVGRSQNQLHIHIDCVNADIRAGLQAHEHEISDKWPGRPLVLADRRYYIIKLLGPDLGTDPFRRLAERLEHSAADMGEQSLSLLGAEFTGGKPGFYLLDSPAGIHGATSEDVLDRDCKVLQPPERQTAH
jgi:CDP-diacylglycerol pyrophosphatase